MPEPSPLPFTTFQHALDGLLSGAITQSGAHIQPLHNHLAARLVLEGGFPPEWCKPRPPFYSSAETSGVYRLFADESVANSSERKLVGGMRSKDVDVTVGADTLGPVAAISAKSTGNAFRNLTNRAEEAPGDAANIHMMYPGLSFGYVHFVRYAAYDEVHDKRDVSFDDAGHPVNMVLRFHEMLAALLGRESVYDPPSKFESVAMVVYKRDSRGRATVYPDYPPPESPLHYSRFFAKLYRAYDIRFGYRVEQYIRKHWHIPHSVAAGPMDQDSGFGWEIRQA